MFSQTEQYEIGGGARRPIQCEGLARGPERMAEVGVTGSVNPQFGWGDLGNIAKQVAPIALSLL
jgi:hypothetical protein